MNIQTERYTDRQTDFYNQNLKSTIKEIEIKSKGDHLQVSQQN